MRPDPPEVPSQKIELEVCPVPAKALGWIQAETEKPLRPCQMLFPAISTRLPATKLSASSESGAIPATQVVLAPTTVPLGAPPAIDWLVVVPVPSSNG